MNIRNCSEPSIRGFRGVALAVTAAFMLTLSACTAIEKAGFASDIDKGRSVLLHHVKTLQAAGDPLGDYFYALGNSDGWIKDVQGDEAVIELFRKAAAKGSMDAKILLALQRATSRPVPGKLDEGKSPRGNIVAWEAGLSELLPLLQQQCFVRRLVVGSGELGTDLRPHVTTYAVAGDIWPKFRDGYYRNNADGTRTLLKDPEREKVWERLHKECQEPKEIWLDRLYNR